MTAITNTTLPWLLYAYPWQPYPRRVIIYLREKGITASLVHVVQVRDHGEGNGVVDKKYPPKPVGSLPILAIPSIGEGGDREYVYIRQSMAIIRYLEEVCNSNQYGFTAPHGSFLGDDELARARINEVLSLADECTTAWNPVRLFGTQTSGFSIPVAAKETLRWVRRILLTIEHFWQDRDMSVLCDGQIGQLTVADIVMYQFLEFTRDCYNVDVTIGSGEKVIDVYGREVEEKFPKLAEFFAAFGTRESAKRRAELGEMASEATMKKMQTWAEGIW